ncbi:MAG: hypothetical protein ABR601_09010 [Parasphingopyxis sp.]
MTIRRPACLLAALAGLSLSAAGGAADPVEFELPEQEGLEIVVYGAGNSEEAVAEFVSTIGRHTGTGQLARWHDTICPLTLGLREELNDYISDTVIALAEEVGAEALPGNCQANLLIMITDNPVEAIASLREDRIDIYQSISLTDRAAIDRGDTDVLAFSRIELRGADGRLPDIGGQSIEGDGALLGGVMPGRTRLSTRADLNFRAILIDADHARGRTLQQLSAFAAMMALAEFDVREPVAPAFTILNLFHEAENAPADLTDWDVAYLRALYATDGAYDADTQHSAMIREVRISLADRR